MRIPSHRGLARHELQLHHHLFLRPPSSSIFVHGRSRPTSILIALCLSRSPLLTLLPFPFASFQTASSSNSRVGSISAFYNRILFYSTLLNVAQHAGRKCLRLPLSPTLFLPLSQVKRSIKIITEQKIMYVDLPTPPISPAH